MDSLTQIVLGAAVGELVLGKKVGNKAMLYGAIAGTIPDLDVLSSFFTDTSRALELHRGFTHSVVFSVLFAPLFAWVITRFERHKNIKDWTWLFFWAFITHPLLDAHTTWGTQLFWPLDLRLAFKTIFVIDPLYTLPFLTCFLLALQSKRTNPRRRLYNNTGLILSSSYLLITVILKYFATSQFQKALIEQNISYTQLDTRPTPLNTILWNANIDTDEAYLLADYSFFDTQPITFKRHEKNHQLLGKLASTERIQRMIKISEGWYIITKENETLYFNDLRFGVMGIDQNSDDFVFKYAITENSNGEIELIEVDKSTSDGKKILTDLWKRLKGN